MYLDSLCSIEYIGLYVSRCYLFILYFGNDFG